MGGVRRALRRFLLILAALSALGGQSAVRAAPVRQVRTEAKRIAVTFDDGPSEEKTREILAILAENGVKATFFVIGQNAEKHPDLIREICEAGHEIGNHTWSHRYISQMSEDDIREDLGKTEALLTEICGKRPVVFRPPGGYWTEKSCAVVESMGYKSVLWSVDTRDWTMNSADRITGLVDKGVENGAIILFHDLADKRLSTPDALRIILPKLLKEGYEFVTVSELLA